MLENKRAGTTIYIAYLVCITHNNFFQRKRNTCLLMRACVKMNSTILIIVFVHLCCWFSLGVCRETMCIGSERETLLKLKHISEILQRSFLLGMLLSIPTAATGLELCATTSHPTL